MDREKVIKEFEHLLNAAKGNYFDFVDLTVDEGEEILALLKEQEAVKPSTYHDLFICPVCKNALFEGQKFCHECGKRIEWEGR